MLALHAKMQEEIVPAVVSCFSSRQDKLFVASARCLAQLRGLYAARPEVLGAHGALIAKTVLKTFEIVAAAPQLSQHLQAKLRARGLSIANSAAVLATSTRLLSALLNNRQSVEWFKPLGEERVALPQLGKDGEAGEDTRFNRDALATSKRRKAAADSLSQSNFFDALVTHIRTALDQPQMQSSALQLLRRVLLRNRMLSAAVYQCMDSVGEIMIASADKRAAQQCAQIYVDFMLDYPHEPKAMQGRLSMLVRNLGYAEESGRQAALNCLYLVATHFPEEELASRWGTLIFAGAVARLPQETDPVCHQMLHVLLKQLLGRVGASGRQKMLDLALSWARSPKVGLHLALAESLGLFAEAAAASGGGTAAIAIAQQIPPALESLLPRTEQQKDLLASAAGAPSPSWRLGYAVSRAFERLLTSFPPQSLEQLPRSPLALSKESSDAAKEKKKSEGDDSGDTRQKAGAGRASKAPREALFLLWRFLLGGRDAFTKEERHSWIIAVALRLAEAQAARCTEPGRAALWFAGEAASGASLAPSAVSASALVRALEGLLSDDRLEKEASLAPLAVRALCGLTKLVLQYPEIMPEGSWEDLQPEGDGDDASKDGSDAGDDAMSVEDVPDAEDGTAAEPANTADVESVPAPAAPAPAAAADANGTSRPNDEEAEKKESDQEANDQDDKMGEEDEDDAESKDEEEKEKEEDEDEEEDPVADAAGGAQDAVEGERNLGPSLYDAVTSAPAEPSNAGRVAAAAGRSAEELLRRSRLHWLVVRMSQRARGLLARPSQAVVRIVSMLRFFTALAEVLPADLLAELLEPLLSPAYRCTSAFALPPGTASTLPSVQGLEDVLNLGAAHQMEFLGQLAQACLDAISTSMTEAGRASQLNASLAKVRRAVEKARAERSQRRRLLPVTDPEAAAKQRRTKIKKKQEGKKRKVQNLIKSTKGGSGGTRVKQSRSLV
eukprot:TRINITY_DN10671_c3_g1_i1.p1 TRINITY_DN10671_c3_g1~~TRINITY_DN10671_c3_g1_i1.p1  ORF type:complete len:955 (+),score=232.42 TRINITY_DN10671_c3_g1_i1:389-3253(+)